MKRFLAWLRSLRPSGPRMIVPERRRRTRVLTLKNAAVAGAALLVMFFLLSLWSEHRPSHTGDSLLDGRGMADPQPVERPQFDVVTEGSPRAYPAAGTIGADTPPPAPPPVARPAEPKSFEPRQPQLGKGKIVITGGSEGVQLHVEPTPPPAPPPPPQ